MRMLSTVLCIAGAVLVGSTSAVAGDKLSGPEIKELLSDKTTYGKHAFKDIESFGYWRADGTFTGKRNSGTWEIKGDKFCRSLASNGKTSCREIQDNGDGTYSHFLAKNGKHIWTWTKIVEGNAEEF